MAPICLIWRRSKNKPSITAPTLNNHEFLFSYGSRPPPFFLAIIANCPLFGPLKLFVFTLGQVPAVIDRYRVCSKFSLFFLRSSACTSYTKIVHCTLPRRFSEYSKILYDNLWSSNQEHPNGVRILQSSGRLVVSFSLLVKLKDTRTAKKQFVIYDIA